MKSAKTQLTVTPPNPIPTGLSVPGGAGYMPETPYQASNLGQTVLTVGTGGEFSSIGAAVAAAQSGDLILVAPGTYTNDFADITQQVTIEGAGGMVNLVATEDLPNEKGIFIVDNSCEIDNVTFQGAHISDDLGGNAAGIRYQGGNLVLNNDTFVGNQDGVLAVAVDNLPQNTITVTNSTFDNNGDSSGPNSGYTHNFYASTAVQALTVTHSVFEEANVGHELKSRAQTNYISNNIFYDGPSGTASYSIDLPNGGADTITGNVIEKDPNAGNTACIHFGGEGLPYLGSSLLVSGNHFVNDLGPQAIGVLNQTTLNVNITGNEFDNFALANIAEGPYTLSGNVDQNGTAIPDNTSTLFAPGVTVDDYSGDNLAHNVTLTVVTGVRGGGGLLTVTADAGHVTVLGGSGGLNYQEAQGFGGSTIVTAAGANDTISAPGQDTIASAGNDTISAGGGNLTVQITGNASITSGSGANQYIDNGAISLTGGGGSDTVQVNGASATASATGTFGYFQSVVQGGDLALNIMQAGVADQVTIQGGSVEMQAYDGIMVFTTAGGTGGTNIQFGSGTVANFCSNGQDTIHAGSGAATVIAAGAAAIYAGTGALAVYGSGVSGASVYGAGGSVLLDGNSGGITYFGGAAANSINAVLTHTTLTGGAGMMNVIGSSAQSVIGGSGGLNFSTAGDNDTITTAAGAHDTVSFVQASTLVSNGTDMISAGTGNSTVTANGNATITGSTGTAFYTLNGHDSLAAYGNSSITVGAAAQDSVTAYGSLTTIAVAGGKLIFSELANRDKECATVTGSGATLQSSAAGTLTSITLAGAGEAASLAGGHFNVSVKSAGTRLATGGGTDTVTVWNGGGMIHTGAGNVTLAMNDWADHAVVTIEGGTGTLTQGNGYGNLLFTGGTGTATLGGVSGSETIMAGAGNLTLTGGATSTNFTAGSGTAAVTLTTGGGTVTFGSGHATITEAAWGNAVTYDFAAGHGGGTDIINGFRNGTDQLQFQGGVSVTQQTLSGGSALLTLSDGTHVTLTGMSGLPNDGYHAPAGHI
jgi:hypothetical protein